MRQIKARIWHNGKMHYFDPLNHELFVIQLGGRIGKFNRQTYDTLTDAIWLQFTGLLDKNGKEIYEGDLITFKAIQGRPKQVWMKNGAFRYGNSKNSNAKSSNVLYREKIHRLGIEIIGDIYTNNGK